MKFARIIFLLFLFFLKNIFSFSANHDQINSFRISVFTDSSNNLGIGQVKTVLAGNPDQFVCSEKKQDPFNPDHTYWIYLQRNDSNCNQEYVFTFRMWVSLIEVYPYPFSSVSNYSGKMIPGRLNELNGCSVYLGAGANGFLLKVQNKIYSGSSVKNIRILPAHIFQKEKEQFGMLQGFIQGLFWLMLLYNLLLYIVVRKKAHLFYVIYIFLNSFYLLFAFNYSETYLFPNNYNLNLILFTFQPIGLFFYTMFLRLMLLKHCPAYTLSIDRRTFYPYSYLLLFVNLIIASIVLFRLDIFIVAFQISNLINCIIGIILLSYFYKKSDKIMHIIIAGSVIMIVFGIRGILNIPADVVINNLYYEIGLLIELLFFSYAINQQYSNDLEEGYRAENKKHQLENQIEIKNRELVYQAIQLSAKEEAILSIKDKIKNLNLSKEINSPILNEIQSNDSMNKNLWKEFELHFSETHPGFYKALMEKYPNLTSNEIKLCAYLKLNLNTKEIAMITQRSAHSIETMRSRIRQKMELPRDTNFSQILSQLQ
jgi:DNA-binding CsgD family transcriptional regulator